MSIPVITFARRLSRLGFIAALFLLAVPGARAGLTFELHIYRNSQGQFYNFFTPLSTNTTLPNAAVGMYFVNSPQWPTNGSTRQYEMTTNGFNPNPISGAEHGYGDFASVMQQITNGTWTILFTNAATTNLFTFTVGGPNMTSNMLPATIITYPSDGALNIESQPTFTWQGPTDWPVNVGASVNNYDFSFYQSASLSASQNNWMIPASIPDGMNCTFQLQYITNNVTPVFVATTPLNTNASHQAISGWLSTDVLETGGSVSFAVTNSPVVSPVLVAHYTFDNGVNLGQDSSGNGYDLGYNGGNGVSSSGIVKAGGGAAYFDGGSFFSYTSTPGKVLSALASDFTISFWINTTQADGNENGAAWAGAGIVDADIPFQHFDLVPAALDGGEIGFNTGGNFGDDTVNSTTDINDGNYHHIVITRNQTTGEKRIYVDGALNNSDFATMNPLSDPKMVAIGCAIDASQSDPNNGNPAQYFQGLLDDLQIYSGVLSAGDVANLFANPGSTVANGGGLIGGHRNVAHYTFDDSNNLGKDSSVNGNDMTVENSWGPQHQSDTDAEAGGGAIRFFGTDSISAENQALTNLNAVLAGSFTFSAWVKTTITNGADYNNAFFGAVIFWAYNDRQGDTNDTIPLAITGSKATFTTRGGDPGLSDNLHSTSSVNDGNYHLITVTRDQSTGKKKMYVDGNLENSETGTTNPLNGNNYNLTIGGWPYFIDATGTNFSSYNGLLDDLQIYSGVLSDVDVASLYANPGATVPDVAGGSGGPVVHYDFNEGSVLAADVSGNNNNVINAGNFGGSGPAISSDAIAGSGSVSFDGGSYLTAPSNLLATLAADFTVSLWVKTSQSFGNLNDPAWAGAGIIAADIPSSAKDLVPVALTAGQVAFNVGDGNSDDTLNSSATVNDNTWHHIVVTRSQSTGLRQIYIDGTLDSSKGGTTALLNDPVLLTIGAKSDASDPDPASPDFNGSNGYEGLLDDIQIYNRVINSSEVAFLYANPGAVLVGGGSNPASDFNAALNTVGLNWTTSGNANWLIESINTHDGVLAAQSGMLTNGQTSTLQTTVTGPGTLSFWWTTLDQGDGFNLQFYLDGNYYDNIYGYGGYWTQDTGIAIPPGQHTLTWTAYGGDSPTDAGFLDQVNISANFAPQIYSGPVDGTVPGAGFNQTIPVRLGSNTVLVVQLDGNPSPTIRWYRNGILLTNASSATLVITNTQFSDTGNYYLTASNYLGTASSFPVYLKVYQDTDLKPLSLSVPPVVSSSSLVPVVWTVTNTGPAAVSNFFDTLAFSAPVVTPDFSQGSLWSSFVGLTVPPASVYSVTNTTHRFPNIPAGNYTLVLNVDANNDIIETNENNNSLTNVPITVINPDMQPGNLKVAAITNLGASLVQFTYNITNNGPGILDGVNFYDELFLSTNATLDSTAMALQQISQTPSLGVGAHFTTTNFFTMPIVPSGDYYLILHVDHFGFQDIGGIWEANETNNYAVLLIHVLEPDLVPTNIIAPALVSSREPIQIGWNIQNQGDGIATNLDPFSFYQWADAVYLSTNQQVNPASIMLGNFYDYDFNGLSSYAGNYFFWNTPLTPGQVMTNLQNIIIPNVPAGNYYLVLAADVANFIREINETNNVFAKPITLGALDLVPTAFTAPPAANARSTIPVTWSVTNQGTGTVYPEWVDRIYISTRAVLDNSAALLGEFVQSNLLAGGASYAVSNTITLNGVGAGNYFLLFDTDAATNVMEVNHGNNVVARPLTINSPDLVATALTVGATFSSQQPFSAVYSVSNAGPVTAYSGWSDLLFFSRDGILETNNLLLGTVVPGLDLALNNSYSELVNSTIPAVSAGNYFVLLQANANQFFAENNTQNNLLAEPVHINNPDLVLTNFAAPSIIVVTQYSQTFEADWSVLNQGAGDAYPAWADNLYLSPTNVLDTNAVSIGSAVQSPLGLNPVLGSGQSYLSFARGYLPDGIQGNYYLLLQVNDNRSLYESTYTNNLVVKPVNLVIPPVPVLSVASVDSPADAWSGQQIYVTWTLTNSGTAAVSGSFYDVVFLCSSAAGANPQPYGEFQFSGQILPGQSIVRQQKIYLPIDLQGTFWVALQTDFGRNIFEFTDRTNEFLVASHPMVVHLTPTPNLVITSVSAPTNMFNGGEGTVSWVETNSGTGPTSAPFWDDAVYLCDTTNFYTSSYRAFLGAPNNVAYLNPGDSYASSADVTLPRGITGTFYFIVWADAGNAVFEGTNKNDNTLTSKPVFVAPSPVPDLQVTTVQPPHDAFSGQPVSVTYAVTNFGLGQTQPSEVQWSDRVFISTNVTLDSSATYLGDVVHNGGLTPTAGYTATTSLTLPVGISGDWYFIVEADINNQVYEAAFEDNNDRTAAFATHIALTPPPDLVATITQCPTNVLSSHVLSVTYTVFNNGTTITPNSGWDDNLYFWTNPVFDPVQATYIATLPHYGALAPGAGYTNTFSLVLPAGMIGTNYIFVQGDAYNVVFELNKTNNLAEATNPVVISFVPSDLAVTSLTAPATCNAGAGILVNWAVTNLGPGDTAISAWSDRLILSQNILPGAPSDVQLALVQHIGLLGTNGAYAVTNQLAQVPSDVAAGNYQLFLVADANQNVPVETNWNNNVYGPVPISITAHSPDLQVVTATGPTNAVSGSTVTVNWTVTNAGDLPANLSYWYDTVYLTANGLLDPNAMLLGYQKNVSSLLPGGSYTNSVAVGLPINIQSNYYFVVVADGFNFIPEAGAENNNSYVINPPVFITPSPVPDLAVTAVITPANAFAGQNFHLSWVVKNVGTTNADGSWYDVAYLSTDQILDPTLDTYLGYTYQTYNLAPGQSYTNSADFPISQGLSGPFYVFVTADNSHVINERGQLTNNTAYNPQAMLVQLLPPVDLVAGQVTIPVNAVPGQNMTVSYTVQNQGENTALGSWQDSLFISADTNWDVGDKLFASVIHTGDVPPGGGYTNVVTAPLPGVLPGDYHVIIRSDILNHLTEADKSNNIAASLNSTAIDVQELALGTPAGNTLGTGQSAFYKFDATNGQTIHLQFTSTAVLPDNELFVKFGQMPDSGNFDAAANAPFAANPEIYFAATNTGTYYLLVKCNYAPAPTPYTVLAEVLPFTVREAQPNISGNVGTTTFFVRGALFDSGTQFALQQQDTTMNAQSVYLADSTAAYVTFNMNGASDGDWDFLATMTDSASNSFTTTLSNAVFVGSADPVDPDVSIDGPLAVSEPSMGYSTHSCLVDYGNSGLSDIAPPLILVQSQEGTTLGTTLGNLQTKTIELLGRSLVGPPDILRPQDYASKVLYFRGGGTHLAVWTLPADSTRLLTDADWQDIENSVRPPGILDSDWLNFWVNIRPRLGSTWGDYVQFLDRVAENFPAEQQDVSQMFLSLYTNAPGFHASAMLTGTLLGAVDGLPQANVELDLMTIDTNSFSGAVAARAQTDLGGNFTFPYLPPGQYYYAVSDSYFDMNRDGLADTNMAGLLMTSTDLVNQTVYLYQPPTNSLTILTNDDTATLVLDGENVLHSFWYRNGSLWHAWNNNGQWTDASVIQTNLIGAFAAGAGHHLLDGTSAGLIIAWSQSTSNNVELFYAVGRKAVAGGYEWSQPVMLTSDVVAENTSPAIAVRDDGLAVITYLKRASQGQDDTDVYYSLVNVASGSLLWTDLAPQSLQQISPNDFNGGFDAASGKVSFSSDKSWVFNLGSEVITYKAALAVNGGVAGCLASASGTGSLGVTTTTPENAVNLSGSVAGNFAWQINPEQCAWEFKSATFDINGGIHYDMKNASTRMLRAIPNPVPQFIAQGIDEMRNFLRSWVTIDDTVGVGASMALVGFGWTHPPAPITDWREPDVYGRDVVNLDASVTLGISTRGSKQVVMSSVEPVDFSFWHPNEVKQVNTLETGTNGAGVSLGFSGTGKILAVFELYPSFHLRSVTPSGELKFSISPYYSFTYPFSSALVADHGIQAHDGSSSDTLPSGWTFSFDPAAFIGDTNVFGTNSVLSNVGADLYQDDPPVLAVDSNGVPFQVWSKFGDPYAVQPGSQVYVADFNGTNWNPPQVLPGSLGLNSEVCAMTDSQGHRLVVWAHADSSPVNTNMTYQEFKATRDAADLVYSTFDGNTWSSPELVATTPGLDRDLQLSRMDDGNILAVWIYSDTNSVQHILSSRWDGKGWDSPTEITSGLVSSPAAQQVAGVTYLLWTQEVDTNHNHSLFSSQNSGAGWSSPAIFSPALLAPAPNLAAVSNSNISPRGLLQDIQFTVTDAERKACCKCENGIANVNTNKNEGCGIASIDYDYEGCHRIFTYKPCQVRPQDPNNIVGPEGYGPQRWVPASTPLNYTIQFENDPTLASAPAKRVSITLPLDSNFDPRTFRLGDFGFGGMIFNIPPGSAFYQTRLDLTATKGYYVDLIAGVDIVNQQAFWTLTTIDPATGDLPQNALVGFLPPDTNSPDGEGFVSCSITPVAGATNGSPVAAKATIVFDNQPPMDTPSALNTLQTGLPASNVLPLPAVTMNPTFDVAWQGVSSSGGSGVSSYDIYASENGGDYYPWLQGITLDHAPFAGQAGSTYAFYSLAHDNIGNVQAVPTNADAVTFVSSNLPPVMAVITNLVVPPDSTIFLKILATDPNGDSLTYSLTAAPAGATINATNGFFRWHPTRAFARTTNSVTVAVMDNGLPPMGTNQTFAIIVQDFLELSLGETNLEGGQTAAIPVSLASNDGATNVLFAVQVPENVLTNWTVAATAPQIGSATLQDYVTNILVTLNTTPSQSLQGTQQVSTLTFSAVTNQVSGFITLPITSVTAIKPGGTSYANYVTHAGTVIVVQNEPLIRAILGSDESRSLQLYGKLGTGYQLMFNTNLGVSAGWQTLMSYTQTNGVITLPLDSSNPVIFYQLRKP